METAVRKTSMGADFGADFRNAVTCSGMGRNSRSAAFSALQFGLRGQAAVPQQIDDFFKCGVVRQRVDVEALIAENPELAIDVTNFGLRGDDAFQPCSRGCGGHV